MKKLFKAVLGLFVGLNVYASDEFKTACEASNLVNKMYMAPKLWTCEGEGAERLKKQIYADRAGLIVNRDYVDYTLYNLSDNLIYTRIYGISLDSPLFLPNLDNIKELTIYPYTPEWDEHIKDLENLEDVALNARGYNEKESPALSIETFPIKKSPNIKYLGLTNIDIQDPSDVGDLLNLRHLDIAGIELKNLSDLDDKWGLHNIHPKTKNTLFLEYFRLSLNNLSMETVTDIGIFHNFNRVSVFLQNNKITDFRPMKHFPSRSLLDIRDNPVKFCPDKFENLTVYRFCILQKESCEVQGRCGPK